MSNPSAPRTQEWTRPLLLGVAMLLVFETLTGLANYLLPFSIPNQVMVLLHTGAGVVLTLPFLVYQWRHWRLYRAQRTSHVSLTGYFAMVATLVLLVSGVVLTVQALAGTRISYAWDVVHLLATAAFLASVLPHVVTLLRRAAHAASGAPVRTGARSFTRRALAGTALLFVLVPLLTVLYRPVELQNALPEDYSLVYGADRPFAPSLARTASGGAYDARSLAGSAGCGTSGCHDQIYQEWNVSAHRYSAMDAAFQKVQSVMGEQNGPESTRYCGGCHDPISLFSGTKNIFTKDLTTLAGYQEGVSCIACHAIKETDTKGNAAYVMTQPSRYMYELHDTVGVPRLLRDFLIRAYPRNHVATLQHTLFKSPEFCAACHKQFIDEEINKVGWVQLQNQFDNWRKSRWNEPGDPAKTIECRECHMPLQSTGDPASGDALDYNRTPGDGKHRSHRFLGANQWMPRVLDLPGGEEHIRLTEQWLRGEIDVPEIADKWRSGPAVALSVRAPASARPGEPLTLSVALTNNKVGHDFPTGPLDIIQAWVEVTVTDQAGRLVFQSGQRDATNFIAPGAFMLKAEPVDQNGNVIDRHNLWEMVGVRYRRALFPGFSDEQQFTFSCPSTSPLSPANARTLRSGMPGDSASPLDRRATLRVPGTRVTELRVHAQLLYRKSDQYLLNFLFGEESGLTSPVTLISEERAVIRVGTND
ncbi:MAG: cytochrome c family protein [Gemmatimonadota bacterium]|nr:cytochrome c family protein [Gemmatimonadota bacterium]